MRELGRNQGGCIALGWVRFDSMDEREQWDCLGIEGGG